jgi:hypothetical protein
VGHFGPRCDYFCAAKWSRTNTKAAFRGHHPASARDFTPRSSIPIHDSDSRFHGRRMLHAALPASASSAAATASSGAALAGTTPGAAAHASHHRHGGPAHLVFGDARLGLPPLPRCTHAEESRGDTHHCDLRIHRNAYKYAPEAGDPDEGHHTPSTNFDGCHRNCAGHAKRAMVECFEWMDDKAHVGERRRCREGLVDMMRECKLYASSADAAAAMAAVRRGDQGFADPCAGVGYTRTSHGIRDTESKCEVCGVSHWWGSIYHSTARYHHSRILLPSHHSIHAWRSHTSSHLYPLTTTLYMKLIFLSIIRCPGHSTAAAPARRARAQVAVEAVRVARQARVPGGASPGRPRR